MKMIYVCIFFLAFLVKPLFAQTLNGTLQQIDQSGIIKVGYRQGLPPMSYLDTNGEPIGYTIELCAQIVEKTGETLGKKLKAKYVPVTSDNRFEALRENRIDLLCGATTKTLSRGEIVDFTLMTFVTGASFMSLKETKIRNNFEGKKIGVSKGTTTAISLRRRLAETQTKAEVVLLDSKEEAIQALDKGEIDALAADQVVLIGLALTSAHPEKYTVLPDLFSYEPYALAIRRNDADFRLVADRAIADLYRSREILTIYNKWFGDFAKKRSPAFDALIQINAIPE